MCYANSNMKLVKKNQKLHNHDSPLLIGEVKEDDIVKEVNEPSYIDNLTKVNLIWTIPFYILNFIGLKFIFNFYVNFHLTENNIDFIISFQSTLLIEFRIFY